MPKRRARYAALLALVLALAGCTSYDRGPAPLDDGTYTLHLWIYGTISHDDQRTVEFKPVFASETWAYADESSDYSVLVLNGDTKVVEAPAAVWIDPGMCGGDDRPCSLVEDAFHASIPIGDAAYTRLELRHKGTVLGAVDASAHAPDVSGVTVTTDQNGAVAVSWTAFDGDADALQTQLDASLDGGDTWDYVTTLREGDSYAFEPGEFATTSALEFRVAVSDGVLSTSAVGGPFEVVDRVPEIRSLGGFGADTVAGPGDRVTGQATIAVAGTISDAPTVTWRSSLDGVIGTGRELDVPASSLSTGLHVITAVATDQNGLARSRSGVLRVVDGPVAEAPALTDKEVVGLFRALAEERIPNLDEAYSVMSSIGYLEESLASDDPQEACYAFDAFRGYNGHPSYELSSIPVVDRGAFVGLAEVLAPTYGCPAGPVADGWDATRLNPDAHRGVG